MRSDVGTASILGRRYMTGITNMALLEVKRMGKGQIAFDGQ
jgi:hypothetical protein